MNQPPIPAGCYYTKRAALSLGISNKQLLKKMRALGWIMNAPNTSRHNLPLRALEIKGFLTTHDRYYKPNDKKNSAANESTVRCYRVTVITKAGFEQLKKIIEAEMNPDAEITTEPTPTSAQEEHDKCIEQLREWGLAS